MANDDLPSDYEYLEGLMRESVSSHLHWMADRLVKQANDGVDEMIKNKIIDPKNRQDYLDVHLEGLDPVHLFQSNILQRLRIKALSLLSVQEKASLEEVPVGILSVLEVNAFAIRTPRGGSAIAVNGSLWPYLKIIMYCVLAMMFRKTSGRIGAHHSDETYALNLFQTVEAMKTGNSILIMIRDGMNSIVDCVGPAARPETSVATNMNNTLLFILLHEYGHIIHGHLDGNLTRQVSTNDSEKVDVYITSHTQEYEADDFAVGKLFLQGEDNLVRNGAFCLSISILFYIFDMCEEVDHSAILGTHPTSMSRLERVHDYCIRTASDGSRSRIQEAIDYIHLFFDNLNKFR